MRWWPGTALPGQPSFCQSQNNPCTRMSAMLNLNRYVGSGYQRFCKISGSHPEIGSLLRYITAGRGLKHSTGIFVFGDSVGRKRLTRRGGPTSTAKPGTTMCSGWVRKARARVEAEKLLGISLADPATEHFSVPGPLVKRLNSSNVNQYGARCTGCRGAALAFGSRPIYRTLASTRTSTGSCTVPEP